MKNIFYVFLICIIGAVNGATFKPIINKIEPKHFAHFQHVDKYDHLFRKYSKRFFGPGFDWVVFKAQGISESGLNPEAVSPVGAKGLMQFMSFTEKEMVRELKRVLPDVRGTATDPKWAVPAGIAYDRKLWRFWSSPRPKLDRIKFMLGSYNAGAGNILKAQRIAIKNPTLNPNLWSAIVWALPRATGQHSQETLNYVNKIVKVTNIL